MDGREELLKERLLQLEEISQRRKVLLGELYHVLKGSVYGGLEDTVEDGLSSFLAQFDFESDTHRGSIENLDEWLQHLPAPFDEEPEEPEEEHEEEPEEEPVEEIQETQEVNQEPEVLEILEEDVEEPSPPTVPIAEDIQPEPIQILPDVDDSEYHTATPPQEPEVHQELSPTNLTPTEIVPPSPIPVTPTPVVEEARSPSPEFVSQSPVPIPLDLSPAPMTPDFDEEPDATTVDVVIISDEDEVQSLDSHIENVPRTPSPTIPSTIDTALLYRGPDQPMIVAPPSPVHDPQYNFDSEFSFDPVKSQGNNELPYSLPLLGSLPPEFRKKTTRAQRKREKERERTEVKKEEDWSPMGMARWRALLRANPTWQYLSRSTKSLTTRDWNVALTELRLIRTFDRIDMLKDSGRWSFRQPKKQRGLGGLIKTHWDYLMDEMKWMRIDFREERKWKIAVAYTLALAVQEWHEAGSTEERIRRGICVVWSKSLGEGIPDSPNAEESNAMSIDLPCQRSRSDSMLVVEESDDGSDEEEKDAAVLADVSMAESEEVVKSELTQEPENMKVEDNFDFTSALQAAPMTESQDQAGAGADSSLQDSREGSDPTPPGMRVTSENPMMSFANNGLSAATQGAMRERVAFMDLNKVFLDADDLGLTNLIPKPSTEEAPDYVPPTIDLVALFGDVQAYGLPEPIPAVVQLDLNKKNRREREDVSRRLDEANTTKLVPVSQFMFCRPTLVSALQPSRHWKDGNWTGLDESPVCPTDTPPFSQEFACSLFERNGYNNYNNLTFRAPSVDPKRVQESRIADQLWTPQDDQLLKDLFGTYGNNWHLIADCFNSLRHLVSTDVRTNWDCYYRFAALNAKQQEPDTPSSSQVTTRTKRQFSLGLDTSGSNVDNKKRRRHYVVLEAFRRLAKKKDSAAKVHAVQTKRQTGLHETHHQINNMPKLTPQELSRKKEYSDLVLRRQAEEARNRQLREQQARLQGTSGAATVNRSALQFPNGVGQTIPQLRGQVNISQQQRLAAALQHQLSQSGTRMSPQQQQQLMQAQVRALEAQQQAQAQAQGQQTQTPTAQQPQSGQTQPQQPVIQIQTHNLSTQPAAQPLVTMMRFADGSSASPPPQQATSSNSGTPVSVNGNSNGSTNGNTGAVTQRPGSGQNQEATAISSPLDPDTAAALQSMFEANDGVAVGSNPNGGTQTRFQATPQPPQQQQTQVSPPQNGAPAATYPTQS